MIKLGMLIFVVASANAAGAGAWTDPVEVRHEEALSLYHQIEKDL